MYLCLIDFPPPTLNVSYKGIILLPVGKSGYLHTQEVNVGGNEVMTLGSFIDFIHLYP